MHPPRTLGSRTLGLGLALTGLCALGAATARPASAQTFQYTLSGVTFADGGVATGTFTYSFTTGIVSAFDVTTTNGTSDGLLGTHYVAPTATATGTSNFLFTFNSGLDALYLNALGPDNVAGTIVLQPGTIVGPRSFSASGEFATPVTGGLTLARVISAGNLIAVGSPVPEASTTASLGLLLLLGMGGLVVAARRRKQA